MKTALQIFQQAYATSKLNEAGRIADESGELLTLLNELLRGYMAEGARVNRKFFGDRLTVQGDYIDATPDAPAVAQQGAAGATAYSYRIIAINSRGERSMISAATQVADGNAVLTAVNFNRITWAAVAGADHYLIIRSASAGNPASTGLIGTTDDPDTLTFDDTGIVATAYSNPAANETTPGWRRPQTAEMIVRLEAGDGLETSADAAIAEGTEIADLPFDQRHIEPGKPAVYSFGQWWYPAGRAIDPEDGPLVVMAAAAPTELAAITEELPELWPESVGNPLLKWDLAIYLATKDDAAARASEITAFAAQRERAHAAFLAHIETESTTEVRSYGHGNRFTSPAVKPAK